MMKLVHRDITERIIGAAFEVHKILGPGFLEGVYEEALMMEMKKQGLNCVSQKELTIRYKETDLQHRYKADLIVEDRVLVEMKASSGLTEVDQAQVFNYLKATGLKVGLLINFGKASLEWKRFVCERYFRNTEQ